MSMLSPAQLVLVLWLLTAAAPAATALLNGSLGVWMPSAVECQAKAEPRAAAVEKEARAVVCDPARPTLQNVRVVLASFAVEDGAQLTLAASVLHTALQRHRPKAA